jgi:NTE family protein
VVASPGESTLVPVQRDARLWVAAAGATSSRDDLRSTVASALPEWTQRYDAIVWSAGPGEVTADAVEPFASTVVTLAGPGDALPEPATRWLIQDAAQPTLARQSVGHRLIAAAAEAERASAEGQPLPDRFVRTIDGLARAILGISVGWVLGAGGARGWSHIGILEVLTRAGLPIDAIAGSSMGAIIGGLVAQGTPIAELRRVVSEWPKRRRQLRELRVWRMHMASERGIENLLRHFFGERRVPELEIPYTANTVDIDRCVEVAITDGLLREAARSSMAFPGWLPPFGRNGRLFVDGATLNPVPVAACRALGAHLLVAVNVLGPPLSRPVPRRWPARQFDIMARTFQLSGYSMGQAHGEQGDVVLTPDLGDAMMTSFDRFDEMIAGGVREAELRLDSVLGAYNRRREAVRAV